MFCLRRDFILFLIQLKPGLNYLKTAPFTADNLFKGRIQAAVRADWEDKRHASLARSNVGSRQGALSGLFPRPLLKDRQPKKLRRTHSLIGTLLFHPLLLVAFFVPEASWQSLLLARMTLQRVSPSGPLFLPPLHRCRRYQSQPDFFTSKIDGSKSPWTHRFFL